jgi:hypothetical protein
VIDEAAIRERFGPLRDQGLLDERGRRLWAAVEARSHGRGGIAAVARATGISESTVARGLAELASGEVLAAGRVRRPGAGNKPVTETHPGIEKALERLVEGGTRGDRQSPLRWMRSGLQRARADIPWGTAVPKVTGGAWDPEPRTKRPLPPPRRPADRFAQQRAFAGRRVRAR